MNKFRQALADKKFTISATIDPPVGIDLGPALELAQSISGQVDALTISDNRGAVARMNPLPLAATLQNETGPSVIMALSCRDRNRLAVGSQIMAAAASGLTGLILVSGDAVTLGDQPGAKPVFDLDAVMALQLAKELLGDDASLVLGASVSASASPLEAQVMKLQKKLAAGAEFIITRPIAEPDQLEKLIGLMDAKAIRPIAQLELGPEFEAAQVVDRASALKKMGAAGLHLSWADQPQGLPELLTALGGLK